MIFKKKDNTNLPPEEELKDLGFGSKVSELSITRLLNKDGTFNVERTGLSFFESLSPYHSLVTMPWWQFNLVILFSFLAINALFAICFVIIGRDSFAGSLVINDFLFSLYVFFFSIQTSSPFGYCHFTPHGILSNIIATFDALIGLLAFALATGLLFARFSKPEAKIIFSQNAIIAPFQDGKALMFRLANARKNQLIELEIKVLFSLFEIDGSGKKVRQFSQLSLQRERVVFFPLHWTIVHKIDAVSPLNNLSENDFTSSEVEILILLSGTDDTFSQTVHARSSYRYDEIEWDVKFSNIFTKKDNTTLQVDLQKISQTEPTN